MTAYASGPFTKRTSLLPGTPGFSWGSFNDQEPPSKMQVTSVAIASNVATLGVTIEGGDAPAAGSDIYAQGIPTIGGVISAAVIHSGAAGSGFAVNDELSVTGGGGSGAIIKVATESGGVPETYTVVSGGSGYTTGSAVTLAVLTGSGTAGTADITASTIINFNVNGIPLSSASFTGATGTVSFALTGANTSTTPSSGLAVVPQPIVGETLAGSETAGKAFALQVHSDGNNQHGVSFTVLVTGAPSAYMVNLQIADIDEDDAYSTVATIDNTTPGTASIGNLNANFVRATQTGSGGTTPKIAVAITAY